MEKAPVNGAFLFMTIDSTLLDADLDDIFSDFDNSIVISGTTYSGLYEEEYVEVGDFSGYKPIFSGKASEMDNAIIDATVTITSDIHNITNKSFTVEEKIPTGRLMQLVLHEV